ncbi:hypothetical protein RUND412_003950 [Rhizina undulata]
MESSSFFYYTPDTSSQTRQHGHFLPHPNGLSPQQQQQHASTSDSAASANMPYPSALMCSRPSSSHLKSNAPTIIHAPTPILATATLSPEALQKHTGLLTPSSPTLLGMDGPAGGDFYFFPSTPTLSSSSTVSTSPMSTVLTTPIDAPWSLDDSCNGTITPADMELPGTPETWRPMTPGYICPPHIMSHQSTPSLLLSACPSLSPSSEHSSSPDIDFCDPRNLTYPSPNPSGMERDLDFATLPIISGDDDDNFMLGNSRPQIKIEEKELSRAFFGLPGLSDLDDDPLASLMDMPTATINPAALHNSNKRQRDSSEESEETWDIDEVEGLSDDESILGETGNMLMPMSPPASDTSRRSSVSPANKYRRTLKKMKSESYDSDVELDEIIMQAKYTSFAEEYDSDLLSPLPGRTEHSITPAPTEASSCEMSDGHCSETHDITPAPVTRRGRKQSLTDDPSKTFVCHLCSRRFRRQEHLKRHFRSLHTKDKPFSCNECGKKFSRSDNLSQHARTHGSTTIHMALIEGGMIGEEEPDMLLDHGHLGIVLVDAAQASSGIKEKISSSSESKKIRRKKKRDE